MRFLLLTACAISMLSSIARAQHDPITPPPSTTETAPASSTSTAPTPASTTPTPSVPRAVLHSPERYVLENGLEVVLDPMGESYDTVAVCVTYHTGARDQPPGYTGLAHLAEHLMFEGSLHAPRHFLDELDAIGAIEKNGVTERDRTYYYELVPSEHLVRALFLEADRMAFLLPAMRPEHLHVQREVVLREREERIDLGGLGLVPGLIASVLYPSSHPYADLSEHREDLDALRIEHLQWFLQTWYAPDNATLVVSGGFDPAEARAAIARWFGPIRRSGPRVDRAEPPPVRQLGVERRLVIEAPVRRDELMVVWPTPAWAAPGDAALDLIARDLQSALRDRLVETGEATAVTVRQQSSDVASEFVIAVSTGRRTGTLGALEAIDAELTKVREQTPEASRVRWLAGRMSADAVDVFEWPISRAMRIGRRIRSAPEGRWTAEWESTRWSTVTADEMRETARTWLPPHGRLVLSLSANRDAPIEGRVAVDLTLGPDGQEIAR